MFSRKLAALAAISMITASSAAVAQSAAPASSAPAARAGVTTEGASELRGAGIYIIGAIVLALIIWGAIELLDDGDSESP